MCPLALRRSDTSALVRQADWATTPLGPIEGWAPALRTAVQLVMNSQFAMSLVWGPALTYIYNDGYIPVLGTKHPSVFGRPLPEVYPEVWDFLGPQMQEVMASGEPVRFEDRLIPLCKTGPAEEAYFTFSYSPLHDDDGRAAGVLAVAYESTRGLIASRRQRLLTSLRLRVGAAPSVDEVWTRMQEAFDTANPDTARLALYEWRPEGEARLLWSAGASQPGSPWPLSGGLVHAAWSPLVQPAVSGAAKSSTRVQPIDGTRVRLTPVHDRTGHPLTVLAVEPNVLVVTDGDYEALLLQVGLATEDQVHHLEQISSRLSAVQAQLSDAEVRSRSLFESTHDGVLYSGPDGTVHGGNPAACAMLGYTEAELIASHRSALFFPDDEVLERALGTRRDAGRFSGELTFRRKDGTPLPVDLSSTIFIDTSGQERVVTIFRDVTERRRLESRAQEMRRMDTLGQLTGGVAHDFNNLLTVIMSAASSIQEDAARGDAEDLARTITQAATQAAALTTQLLAFARRQPLHPLPTDLSALLLQIDALLRRALTESVSINVERGPDLWAAMADPAQLEVAVLNLALNARDAMPVGGVITIGVRNRTIGPADVLPDLVEGDYVELTVRDTGTGMSPEVASRAFEPFFTTKAPGRGTGLGLSMVYGVARQLGGTAAIESVVGQGTTVRLLLPRALSEPAVAAVEASGLPAARPGEVVLVVEDNDMLRLLVRPLLRRLGYEVLMAADAAEAVAVLDQAPRVDLVFSDVLMPGGMDGRQLAQHVRDRHPDVGVLLTSGYMDPHTVSALVAEHAYEHLLAKPYQLSPLARAVRSALDARTRRPSP